MFQYKKKLLASLAKVQGNKCISMRDFELWQSMTILWQHNNISFKCIKSEIDEFFVCFFFNEITKIMTEDERGADDF